MQNRAPQQPPLPSPFALAAPAIFANGYSVLPLIPRDKAPGERANSRWRLMAGWNRYRDARPEPFILKLWASYPDAGIGVVLGTPAGAGWELAAVDIDTEDDMVLGQIESALPPSPVRKRGGKGYTAFYRVPPGTKGRNWRRQGRGLCDLLTGNQTRQTVLPPSIHPTGVAYQWLTDQTLETVRPEDLPALMPDQIDRLVDTLDALADASPAPRSSSHGSHDETHWNALNQAALDRLDDWVPLLNLPKLARKHDRWEAVAAWRPSSTGRPLMQRKANLSIHRDGIKDFGTDQTYSALDLLMASQSWPLDTAFAWLSDRLGMLQAEEWPEDALPKPAAVEAVTESLPQALKWHKAAPDDGKLPGLLGDIAGWIMATARRPNPVLAMGAAVTVLGTLAGRRAAGPTLSGTHLYMINLADSGTGKDHVLQQIPCLLEAANAPQLLGPGKFMSETSMVNALKRQACCLCPMDEFGVFLKKINSPRASSHEMGMSSFLREAWGRSFKAMVTPEWGGRPSETIHAPAMSIYGVSTPKEFFDALTGDDVVNGFMNRFLMLDGNTKVADADPSADPLQVPAALAGDLVEFYQRINRNTPGEISNPFGPVRPAVTIGWGTGARECWETMKAEIEPLTEEAETGSFWRRTVEIALRLATIRALGNYSAQIELADMIWARDIASASALQMKELAGEHMASTYRVALRNRIFGFVKRSARKVSRTEIQRFLRSEVKKKDLMELLDDMTDEGIIKSSPPEKPKIGRPPSTPMYWV